MGKTNTSSTDLTAGAESLHPRRTGRKEVEVMRMKCKGGEKYKNKDRRLGQLKFKRKSYFFPSVVFNILKNFL